MFPRFLLSQIVCQVRTSWKAGDANKGCSRSPGSSPLTMAPASRLSPPLAASTAGRAHAPARQMQVTTELLEGERDFGCLAAMEAATEKKPGPRPTQGTRLHHTACCGPQRVPLLNPMVHEKGADLQLPTKAACAEPRPRNPSW